MEKVIVNTANKKKLELKKTVIANLQMGEGQMKLVLGGVNKATKTRPSCNTAPGIEL